MCPRPVAAWRRRRRRQPPLTAARGLPARCAVPPRLWAGAGCAWRVRRRQPRVGGKPCRPLAALRLLGLVGGVLASLWVGVCGPHEAGRGADAVAVAGLQAARCQAASISPIERGCETADTPLSPWPSLPWQHWTPALGPGGSFAFYRPLSVPIDRRDRLSSSPEPAWGRSSLGRSALAPSRVLPSSPAAARRSPTWRPSLPAPLPTATSCGTWLAGGRSAPCTAGEPSACCVQCLVAASTAIEPPRLAPPPPPPLSLPPPPAEYWRAYSLPPPHSAAMTEWRSARWPSRSSTWKTCAPSWLCLLGAAASHSLACGTSCVFPRRLLLAPCHHAAQELCNVDCT